MAVTGSAWAAFRSAAAAIVSAPLARLSVMTAVGVWRSESPTMALQVGIEVVLTVRRTWLHSEEPIAAAPTHAVCAS